MLLFSFVGRSFFCHTFFCHFSIVVNATQFRVTLIQCKPSRVVWPSNLGRRIDDKKIDDRKIRRNNKSDSKPLFSLPGISTDPARAHGSKNPRAAFPLTRDAMYVAPGRLASVACQGFGGEE
ncbi:MAG: hypothetical protein JXA69_16495 [Phycisphaerae bacterium]|nr:hypothetical protein [Phycisphaerae bacterium]